MIFLNPISTATHHQASVHKLRTRGAASLLPVRGCPEQICLTTGFSCPLPSDGLDVTVGCSGNSEQPQSSQHWSLSLGTGSHLCLGSESWDSKVNMSKASQSGFALCLPHVKPASLSFPYPNILKLVGCKSPLQTPECSLDEA